MRITGEDEKDVRLRFSELTLQHATVSLRFHKFFRGNCREARYIQVSIYDLALNL